MSHSRAWPPCGIANNGLVGGSRECLLFFRFSPWKCSSAFRPLQLNSNDGLLLSFGTKLFVLNQHSMNVLSNENCSLERGSRTCGRFRAPITSLAAISLSSCEVLAEEAGEAAEQQIVIKLLHQLSFRMHCLNCVQQKNTQQALRSLVFAAHFSTDSKQDFKCIESPINRVTAKLPRRSSFSAACLESTCHGDLS
jgi:hypothetical protein